MLYAFQVNLYPGPHKEWKAMVGPGPQLDAAPHVKSFFLPRPDGWQDPWLSWIRPSGLDAQLQCRCRQTSRVAKFASHFLGLVTCERVHLGIACKNLLVRAHSSVL